MKKKIAVMPATQMLKMQLFFFVFFFFMGASSFAQVHVSNDTKFFVSSGTTVIDDEISTVPEKALIYVAEGTVLYNFDKIETAEIIELETPEKVAINVKKLPENVPVQSSVKNTEPHYHFNASTSSSILKEIQYSLSTIVLQQYQQIKATHLTQYYFQINQIFFFNLWIGTVLLLVFNLLFQALKTRPPPLFLFYFLIFRNSNL